MVRGEIGVRIRDRIFSARQGTWIFRPRNVFHTFWNPVSGPARLIEIITPGAFERHFEELAAVLAAGVPPDLNKIHDLDTRCGHRIDMQ